MMSLLSKMLYRQGELLLNKAPYAYAIIFLFASLPFMTWLSVSIMAFITLRKGPTDGVKALGFGLLGLFIATMLTVPIEPTQLVVIFLTFVPVFISACLLRLTASWQSPAFFLLILSSLIIILFHFYPPSLLFEEYQALMAVLQELQKNGAQLQSWLNNKKQILAYLLGFQAMILLLSALSSLLIARAFQAKLFYPNGFKREILAFRIPTIHLIPFILIALGVYFKYPLGLSLLPIWAVYLTAGGLSTTVALFAAEKRAFFTFFLLLVAMSFLPFIILPIIVSIGALDSLLNFRQRFNHPKSGANSSKGV